MSHIFHKLSEKQKQPMSIEVFTVDPEKLLRMLMLHVRFVLIDLREKSEYDSAHIRTAINISEKDLGEKAPSTFPNKDIPIILYDSKGDTALTWAEKLSESGYLNVVYLEGGFEAFQAQPDVAKMAIVKS